MAAEIPENIATQKIVSAFAYTQDNLASIPVSLFIFGSNIIESLSKSKGGLNAIYSKNPVTNEAEIVGTYRSAPELGEMPFRERALWAAANYLERVFDGDCRQVFLIKLDTCGRPDDLNTWDSMWLAEGLRLNDISVEALQTFDESAPVEMTGTFSVLNWNRILPIRFTQEADSTVLAEIIDIIYADMRSCGTCGRYSDGCEAIYALARANSGSPGLSSQLVYRVEDGGAYSVDDIDALGGLSGSGLAAAGRYLVVISEAAGKHVYATKPTKAGQAVSWASVSSGYQAGGSPRAIYAKSPSEIFIAGAGGYIYKSEDLTAAVEVAHDASLTTQNFNAIHGSGQVVVAVGDAGAILMSINNGESYSTIDYSFGSVDLLSVWVINANQWYVGDEQGRLWYTDDKGGTFVQRSLPNQGDLSAILDIVFSPDSDQVGYLAIQTNANTGLVYRTISGGRNWYTDAPGIDQLTANERINAIATCGVNAVAAGGKKTGSTDGLIAVAKS
jgi:photosystem II stability/assembly factor-like uncharacterized protein